MSGARGGLGSGWLARFVIIGLIVLLEVGVLVYIFPSNAGTQNTFSFSFSTNTHGTGTSTHTTHTTSTASVNITSAKISGDMLSMVVKNSGTSWTKNISIFALCTPGFAACYSYATAAGRAAGKTLVIPPNGQFVVNVGPACVVPILNCRHFLPVIGYTYYFTVRIYFISGGSKSFPIAAKAVNAYPASADLRTVSFRLTANSKNGTGRWTTNVGIKGGLTKASFTGYISATTVAGSPFEGILLSMKSGCGGTFPTACSTGSVNATESFSTVDLGVGTPLRPLPYLLEIQDMSIKNPTYFTVWVTALNK